MAHTDRHEAWTVSWWRGNVAASGPDDADRARLSMVGGYPSVEFAIPEQMARLYDHIAMLKHAFEAGKKQRSAEIRNLIILR